MQIQVYDTVHDSWNTPFSLPSIFNGGGSMAAVLVQGIIYICGGIDLSSSTINTCTKYNMGSQSFQSMSYMPVGVNHAAYATDGTNFYVIGGR
jgi:hypothetical protein